MKKNYLIYLLYTLVAMFVISCDKSDDELIPDVEIELEEKEFPVNYIKAKIDNNDLIIYGDNSLNNNSDGYFSFSFRQFITAFDDSDRVDTTLCISGYLNREQLSITFPLNRRQENTIFLEAMDHIV
jgi:hypothetical protein